MNDTLSIDQTIGQVERLYRSLTGREAPALREQPYAAIPPERVPEEHVQDQVDRLVETLAEFAGQEPFEGWKPPISMWEARGEIAIGIDLPGVTRDGVHVSLSGGMLEIHGVRPPRMFQDGTQVTLKYSESAYGKFRRMIPLPSGLALDQLQAQMRSGVLEIRIPRTIPQQDVKTIHVA